VTAGPARGVPAWETSAVVSPVLQTAVYVLSPDKTHVLLIHRNKLADDVHSGKYLSLGGHVEQADVAHPLEMRADGVGVKTERFGDIGGGQRLRRANKLQVDGITSVVPERLQQVEARQTERRVRRRRPAHLIRSDVSTHNARLHGDGQ